MGRTVKGIQKVNQLWTGIRLYYLLIWNSVNEKSLVTNLILIFTTLKLTGYIDWNWYMVILPAVIHGSLNTIEILLAIDSKENEEDVD